MMIPTVGVDVLVSLADKLSAPLRDAENTVAKASERMNKRLQLSMKLAGAGAATGLFAEGVRRVVTSFTDSIREVERAKGELATLGVQDLNAVVQRGYEMQTQLAGITADAFVRASYDIKSGISTLSDQGVADMTAAAMLVAKATRGQAEQMTSLFATSYGIFKDQYAAMTDADFGNMFGAALSASVKQFKTDGAQMQQAIETAGAGAVNLGMQMTEQLTLLGMMQQQMQAGEAGTALRAFATNAAKADAAFGKMRVTADHPVRVRILDDNGQLRAMPDILTDLRARYGETLDAFEAAEIKNAFGTDEAMKMINALYGQEEAVRANAEALNEAAAQGEAFTATMARAADNNWDAAMVLMGQKWDVLRQKIGERLLPVVERLMPYIDAFIEKAFTWIDANPDLVTGIGAVVVGLGTLATIITPLLLGASALVSGWAMMSFGATRLALAVAGGGRSLLWLGRLVLPLVGKAILLIGRALIANPIGAIIMGIAVAAFLIYKYWEPISGFFQDLWSKVTVLFERGKALITGAIDGLTGFDWSSLLSLEGLSAAWSGITRFAGQWFGLLWDALSPLSWFGLVKSEDLGTAWEKVTAFVGDVASKVWDVIKFIAWVDYVGLTTLIDAWEAVVTWLADRATSLWDDITTIDWHALIGLEALAEAWQGVTAFFSKIDWKSILPSWNWEDIIPFYDLGQRLFFGDKTTTPGVGEARRPNADFIGPMPPQARASGGWFKPGWLLTGEQGPELRYATEGGFIAHNRALRGMLDMASRTRDLMGGIGFDAMGTGAVPALATVAAAAGPTMQRGPITLSPQYHMPISFDGRTDMEEVRAAIRHELIAAEERAQADLRRLMYD